MRDDAWTILVFGDDWGRNVSTMQHIFLRLIDRATIVWIDAIGHREPSLSLGDLKRAIQKIRAMTIGRLGKRSAVAATAGPEQSAVAAPTLPLSGRQPQVHIRPRVLPWHSNRLVRALNRWSLRRDIRRALHGLGDPDRVLMVTGSPPSAPVVGTNGERASFYLVMDDFLELPGTTPSMIEPLENELLGKVDAVVATAARLVEKKRAASGRGYHLPQGVNFDHFASPRPVPSEMAALPRPIVGFAGGVGAAVDFETVAAIARENSAGSVVLVGPVSVDVAALRLPNVHILGSRPYVELPAYVQAFDVGIIPYVENDWTRAVDPLKLLEYLAAGIPVVATPLPEVMKYAESIRVAPLGAEFVRATMAAAADKDAATRERGRAVARQNTWEVRADRFMQILEDVVAARRSA